MVMRKCTYAEFRSLFADWVRVMVFSRTLFEIMTGQICNEAISKPDEFESAIKRCSSSVGCQQELGIRLLRKYDFCW